MPGWPLMNSTIQICQEVEKVLGSKICKNLFLCNRQQTDFYLLMMPGDKPFKTKFLFVVRPGGISRCIDKHNLNSFFFSVSPEHRSHRWRGGKYRPVMPCVRWDRSS